MSRPLVCVWCMLAFQLPSSRICTYSETTQVEFEPGAKGLGTAVAAAEDGVELFLVNDTIAHILADTMFEGDAVCYGHIDQTLNRNEQNRGRQVQRSNWWPHV